MFHKAVAPAAERNKEPILQVLKKIIKVPDKHTNFPSIKILEIASGTGQHIAHFAQHLSDKIFWQPSDNDRRHFSSICAYIQECDLKNVAPPLFIDIREPFSKWEVKYDTPISPDLQSTITFEEESLDYIYNSNLIHISPFSCTEGLFQNSGKLLKTNGCLITYGPYGQNGVITPESNVKFDAGLRSSDPSWGIRDIQLQLVPLGQQNRLHLMQIIDMPANNKVLIWLKQ